MNNMNSTNNINNHNTITNTQNNIDINVFPEENTNQNLTENTNTNNNNTNNLYIDINQIINSLNSSSKSIKHNFMTDSINMKRSQSFVIEKQNIYLKIEPKIYISQEILSTFYTTKLLVLHNTEEINKIKSTIKELGYLEKGNKNYKIGNINTIENLVEETYDRNAYYKEDMLNNLITLSYSYFRHRSVFGDGNCFYRAVIFLYLENIVFNGNSNAILDFIYYIHNRLMNTKENAKVIYENKNENVKKTYKSLNFKLGLNILSLVYSSMIGKNKDKNNKDIKDNTDKDTKEAYRILFVALNCSKDFDNLLVYTMRFMLYEYINDNKSKIYHPDFQVSLGNFLPSQYELEDESFLFDIFFEEHLFNLYEYAERIVIYLTPFVLKVNLNIVMYEKGVGNNIESKEFSNYLGSSSNSINLLYKESHYEIFYTKDYFNEYSKFLSLFIDPNNLNNNKNLVVIDYNMINIVNNVKSFLEKKHLEKIELEKKKEMEMHEKIKSGNSSLNNNPGNIGNTDNKGNNVIAQNINYSSLVNNSNNSLVLKMSNISSSSNNQSNLKTDVLNLALNNFHSDSKIIEVNNNNKNSNINKNQENINSMVDESSTEVNNDNNNSINSIKCTSCNNPVLNSTNISNTSNTITSILQLTSLCLPCISNEINSLIYLRHTEVLQIKIHQANNKININNKNNNQKNKINSYYNSIFNHIYQIKNYNLTSKEIDMLLDYTGSSSSNSTSSLTTSISSIKSSSCTICSEVKTEKSKKYLILKCKCFVCSPNCIDDFSFTMHNIRNKMSMENNNSNSNYISASFSCLCDYDYDSDYLFLLLDFFKNNRYTRPYNDLLNYFIGLFDSKCSVCCEERKHNSKNSNSNNNSNNMKYKKLKIETKNTKYDNLLGKNLFHQICMPCFNGFGNNGLKSGSDMQCNLCEVQHKIKDISNMNQNILRDNRY